MSSALSISKDTRQTNYDSTRVKQLDVDMVTLDDIVNSFLNLEKPVLLKLDVQGYERNVLDGARETLQYVDSLVLEVPFVQLYDEQLLFPELNDYLERLDFHFVAPLYANASSDHSIIEMDVLYHPGKRHI